MHEINEKLARFTSTIMAEASAEVHATEQEIAQTRRKKLQKAEAEAIAEADAYYDAELKRIQAEAGRQVSLHMLENKRTLSLQREELAQEIFSEVRKRIVAFTKSPDYTACLKQAFSDILLQIGSNQSLIVYLRPDDTSFQSELNGLTKGTKIEFLEGSFRLGGLIVECPAKKTRFDATFDTASAELDGHFAALFGLSLSDA